MRDERLGHVLPVAEDPDDYYKIRRGMQEFPYLYSDQEKKAYGLANPDPRPFGRKQDWRTGGAI